MKTLTASSVVVALLLLAAFTAPAQASLVNTPCGFNEAEKTLEYLQLQEQPPMPGAHDADTCGPLVSVGNPNERPPPDEFLDILTNLVYERTPSGLVPVGLAGPGMGYTELTTVSRVQPQTPEGYYEECCATYCDSTTAWYACTSIPAASVASPGYACSLQICQTIHIAVTGCYTVTLTFQFSDNRHEAPDVVYPCPSANAPRLPALPVKGGVGEGVDVGASNNEVTALDAQFSMTPGCWWIHPDGTWSQEGGNVGDRKVPETLTTTIKLSLNGNPDSSIVSGSTRVPIC